MKAVILNGPGNVTVGEVPLIDANEAKRWCASTNV
jgi:hypothetical protein